MIFVNGQVSCPSKVLLHSQTSTAYVVTKHKLRQNKTVRQLHGLYLPRTDKYLHLQGWNEAEAPEQLFNTNVQVRAWLDDSVPHKTTEVITGSKVQLSST